MNDAAQGPELDLGEYCRTVEEHLTRVNDGHLVRIAGTGFERVRQWALDGIPLSVVCRGIDLKAERHRTGRSRRPLRIEFCEGDVRDLYDHWRRAVGIGALTAASPTDEAATSDAAFEGSPIAERRRPSVTKQLDRIIEKLGRAAGRLDTPDPLRDVISLSLEHLAVLREGARRVRRAGRAAHAGARADHEDLTPPDDRAAEMLRRLGEIERSLMAAAREAAGRQLLDELHAAAERDLAAYRGRMPAEAWSRSVGAATEQSLRDRFGLPTFDLGQ